ncbi:MAG: hypothetical protein CM1200mP10_05650 [Candidatus Neomarinimicrobiota bacterium]|nr:MAG: hypothetical protein CM1200mP10_05650 [Candidatus Neomarinimicrobiota bacterium]
MVFAPSNQVSNFYPMKILTKEQLTALRDIITPDNLQS